MGPIGVQELVIIAGLAVLIFGSRHLPKVGRVAGEASKELRGIKRALDDTKQELEDELKSDVKL